MLSKCLDTTIIALNPSMINTRLIMLIKGEKVKSHCLFSLQKTFHLLIVIALIIEQQVGLPTVYLNLLTLLLNFYSSKVAFSVRSYSSAGSICLEFYKFSIANFFSSFVPKCSTIRM